jgi:hypothetical protein
LVLTALALAACSGDPAAVVPHDAAAEPVAAERPSGNGTDVAPVALDAATLDASWSEEVIASDGPAPDEGVTEDAKVTSELGVIEVDVIEVDIGADVPVRPLDAGAVDVQVAPRDAGAVDVQVAPRDTGIDVHLAPRDTGVDVHLAPRDTGVDVHLAPRDTGVDVHLAPLDTGVDVPVAPMDRGPDIVVVPDLGVDIGVDLGVDVGVDVGVPRDDGPPPVDVGVLPMVTGVPRIDGALKAAMRAVYLRGLAAGNRAAVFVKVGDSITQSGSFLWDYGPTSALTRWSFGAYSDFEPPRAYFNATLVDERHSSFDRESLAADSGWTSTRALAADAMLLRQELSTLRPSIALIMLGSGDVDVNEVSVFRANLTRVVQIVLAANVIPVLSTIPRRTNSATTRMMWPFFVEAIREVAAAQQVPLQDYWIAMEPLPGNGLSEDGEHPSVYRLPSGHAEPTDFTPAGLAYGYNVRNLQTLATLAHVRAVVFDDGPADP